MEMVLGIFMMFCNDYSTEYPLTCKEDLKECVVENYDVMVCASEDMDSCVFQKCYDDYFFRHFDRK